MIEKLKQLYTDLKLRNVLKREFSPTEEEMSAARNAFMLHAGFMPKVRASTKIVFLRYSLAAVAVVILLNGVATIYADTTDVPPTHPLYEYKLLAEEVKVRTAPAYKRPELEAKLVEKRIQELATLSKASTPLATPTPSTPATSTISTSSVAVHHPDTHIEATVKQNLKMYLDAVYNANKQNNNKGNKNGNGQKQWLKQQAFCTSDLQSVALLNNSEDNKEITQKIMHLCNTKPQQGDIADASTSTPTTTPMTIGTTTQSTSTDVGILIPNHTATSTSHKEGTSTHQTISTTSTSTIYTSTYNGDDSGKKNPGHRNRRFEIQPEDFQF